MNRQECESKILEKLKDIIEIYQEYNPGGKYLSMAYMATEVSKAVMFCNRYYDEDSERPVDFWAIDNG